VKHVRQQLWALGFKVTLSFDPETHSPDDATIKLMVCRTSFACRSGVHILAATQPNPPLWLRSPVALALG
jgi:hypothetical protein